MQSIVEVQIVFIIRSCSNDIIIISIFARIY